MGLDMYVYTIDAKLVVDEPETDVEIFKVARKAVGFNELTDEDQEKLPEDQLKLYWLAREDATKKAQSLGLVDFDFHYWRKHHDLHGWMGNLYDAKGGSDATFNCVTLRLNSEDLDTLERSIRGHQLPATSGFFFGNNPPDEESNFEDLNFIDKARQAIKSGKAVFYDSWW